MTLFRETAEDLSKTLKQSGVSDGESIAVAVSGGADSMALVLLAHTVTPVHALVVDHAFRENSAEEARWVCSQLNKRGIPNTVLTCDWPETPNANIQALGRSQRYTLMTRWCDQNNVRFLLTGHHLEDQAETLLLRLARGSGVYGLAGMAEARELSSSTTLLRPLLRHSKHTLRGCLQEVGQDWIDDPSNRNETFDRVKVRRFLENPPLEGFSPARLAETATRLRRTRDALEHYEYQWLSTHAKPYVAAMCVELDLAGLAAAPTDIVLRGLKTLIQRVGGAEFGVRFEKLERLYAALQTCAAEGIAFSGQTLGGAQIAGMPDDKILIARELSAVEGRRPARDGMVWDNRYSVQGGNEGDATQLEIGPLGADGAKRLYSLEDARIGDTVKQIPKLAMPTMPALWDTDTLVSVPAFDLVLQDRAGLPKVQPTALLKRS